MKHFTFFFFFFDFFIYIHFLIFLIFFFIEQPHKHFDEENASEYTVKLAYAISYLHNNYVVHRDLKPENILLTKDRELKITDFGLSHYMKISKDYHSMHTCCGTPHYVAPEVLAQKSYKIQKIKIAIFFLIF